MACDSSVTAFPTVVGVSHHESGKGSNPLVDNILFCPRFEVGGGGGFFLVGCSVSGWEG